MWNKLKQERYFRSLVTLAAVAGSALMQAFVIEVFIRPAGLLSGGFTGLAILTDRITSLFGVNISTSAAMVLFNIPVALACSKSISRRFTFYSLFQVFLASLFLQILHFHTIFDDTVLNVIYGGVLFGFATVLALRGNASTGGTDFIALYVSNKTGKSIWNYVFFGNVVLLSVFGVIFGWDYAGYSILFQFISTMVVSRFHHRYEQVTLQITTSKGKEMVKAYVGSFRHGISCVDAVGGYSGRSMYLLHTVVSSYEVEDIVRLLQEVDEHMIVNMFRTQQFIGSFYRKPLS